MSFSNIYEYSPFYTGSNHDTSKNSHLANNDLRSYKSRTETEEDYESDFDWGETTVHELEAYEEDQLEMGIFIHPRYSLYTDTITIMIPEVKQLPIGKVLTGKSVQFLLGTNCDALRKTLLLCEKIILFVQNHINYSPNFPGRGGKTPPSQNLLNDHLKYVRDGGEISDEEWVRRIKEKRIGNCGEMAAIGTKYPLEEKNASIEYFCISEGDHAFLVVNRNSNTHPEHHSNWNPDTAICDPWANAYYPATLHRELLMDYLGDTEISPSSNHASIHAPLVKYLSKNQKIKPIDENTAFLDFIYSSSKFD